MLKKPLVLLFVGFMIMFLVAPVLAILPLGFNGGSFLTYPMDGTSFRWYKEISTSTSWLNAMKNSFLIAIASTCLATLLGTLASLGLASKNIAFAGLVKTVFLLPMVVPAVIMGVGMQIVFSKIGLSSSFLGVVIAHTLVCIPFVLINVLASFNNLNPNLMKAASSLGANNFRVFFKVILPLILPGIIAGAVFSFAISLDEVVITMFIAGPQQWTLALQIFSSLRENISPAVIAAASILIVSMLVLILSSVLFKRLKQKI